MKIKTLFDLNRRNKKKIDIVFILRARSRPIDLNLWQEAIVVEGGSRSQYANRLRKALSTNIY